MGRFVQLDVEFERQGRNVMDGCYGARRSKLKLSYPTPSVFSLNCDLKWRLASRPISPLLPFIGDLAPNEDFISHKSPGAGFDFTSARELSRRFWIITRKLRDLEDMLMKNYQKYLQPINAYTMYDKDNYCLKLSVRDLNSAWAKGGEALAYVVTDSNKILYRLIFGYILSMFLLFGCSLQGKLLVYLNRIFCSMLGSTEDDVLLLEEVDHNVFVNIRHTKDFRFVTVFLINAADPFAGLKLVWECEALAHRMVERHGRYAAKDGLPVDNHYLLCCPVEASSSPGRWEVCALSVPRPTPSHVIHNVFADDQDLIIEDVNFSETHLQGAVCLKELKPIYLPLPKYVCQISPGPKYDHHCSTMHF
ncbi:hypothetical protein RJ641_021426 [Dillenia turbinata]|uniref:Uncharacterized protein n=1 Tax=Dillenia turbinata TaxID=194707 RepID=A0AAN8UEQ7_9MAGN